MSTKKKNLLRAAVLLLMFHWFTLCIGFPVTVKNQLLVYVVVTGLVGAIIVFVLVW